MKFEIKPEQERKVLCPYPKRPYRFPLTLHVLPIKLPHNLLHDAWLKLRLSVYQLQDVTGQSKDASPWSIQCVAALPRYQRMLSSLRYLAVKKCWCTFAKEDGRLKKPSKIQTSNLYFFDNVTDIPNDTLHTEKQHI